MNDRRIWKSMAAPLAGYWLAAWIIAAPIAEITLTAKIAPDGPLTIGDRIELKITAQFPAGWRVRFPAPGEKLGEFQVGEHKLLPAAGEGVAQRQEWIVSLVCFRTGRFEVPEIRTTFTDPQGQETEKSTPPIPVEIVSVIKDQKPELRDLKPQVELPEDYTWVWIGLLCVLIGAAAAMFLRRFLKNRKRPKSLDILRIPLIPPHEEARRALDALLAKNLPVRGLLREFYFELSEIIRRMVGRQYNVIALERTTVEILEELHPVPHEPLSLKNLEDVLERCDLIKFAKHEPLPEEQAGLLEGTRGLIDSVRLSFEAAARAALAANVCAETPGGDSR